MARIVMVTVVLLMASPALACDDAVHQRLLKQQTQALEDQARTARRIERLERDRLKLMQRQAREQR